MNIYPQKISKTRQLAQIGAPRSTEGFALIIALGLAAFVLLLLLSVATFIRVESRVSAGSLQQLQARQNALLALNIAVGELQKHTGPDQRVTGAADLEIPESVLIESNTSGAEAASMLDAHWHDRRNRHWTGVWQDPNPDKADFDKENLPANNATASHQAWLVSQHSNVTINPSEQVSSLSVNSKPKDLFTAQTADGQSVPLRMLVGINSNANLSPPQRMARVVTAPAVPINSGAQSKTDGNFSWWIGDEGVKSRTNLTDPYAPSTADTKESRFRLQAAQRNAIEAMTGDSTGFKDLSTFNHVNAPILDSLLTREQLKLLDPIPPERFDENFHDLTLFSSGVLSDVREGGLKFDLSRILSTDDLDEFRSVIGSIFEVSMESGYNLLLDPKFTPYATIPSNPPGVSGKGSYAPGGSFGDFMELGATWEQLHSHFNLKNAIGASPAGVFEAPQTVAMRNGSNTEQAIFPLITHAKIFYELEVQGGTVWVHSVPLVVLANPYNVDIKGSVEVEIFRYAGENLQLLFGKATSATPNPDNIDDFDFPVKGEGINKLGLDEVRLVIYDAIIPAGSAQIFMLQNDVSVTNSSNGSEAVMVNDYLDPTHARVRLDTGLRIEDFEVSEEPATHVALKIDGMSVGAQLRIIENGASSALKYSRFMGKDPWPDNSEGINKTEYVVYPTDGPNRRGAGLILTRQDPIAQRYPSQKVQQALIYQLNLRGYASGPLGKSTGNIHGPGILYVRPGTTVNIDRFEDHLMLGGDPQNLKEVRWGIVHNGQITKPSVAPEPVDATPIAKILLYDLPRETHPMTSLGQLQHFNMAGRPSSNPKVHHYAHSFQVNYPGSNSYAHPRVFREMTFSTSEKTGPHWDASYMLNHIFWDRFFFSSFPSSGDFDFTEDELINHRLKPFRPNGEVALDEPENFRGTGTDAFEDSKRAAENLMVSGAFNVNSTSIQAWKAVLSSLRGVPIGAESDASRLTAPFARTLFQTGTTVGSQDPVEPNAWEGFTNLDESQIQAVAEEIVLEVMRRGPFMSMADFVNRQLVKASEDTFDSGLSGALQTAIDRVVNQQSSISDEFKVQSAEPSNFGKFMDDEYLMPSILSGFPGYLLQGDVLSALGPFLAARSDTFVIRTYGDATNPVSGETITQAWAEAVVQRIPDYLHPEFDASIDAPTNDTNQRFGRRYKIIHFRWLDESEI